ncbi:DNA adenine methylase [Paenibacillus sp. DYY-L-2]|jgi:DNA adenine methylase|uniref:DNA adenine methylase n=1 Tax=Paenibacillus sp. DYY-L-2 TaxID=3447013 RepID=UPI003F5003E7
MSRKKLEDDFYYPDTEHEDSLVPYVGGKAALIGHIVPVIDYAIRHYKLNEFHELCGGGARMLLNLPFGGLHKRVYNDIDTGMAALFYCCSNLGLSYRLTKRLLQEGIGEEVFQEAKRLCKEGVLGENGYDMVTAAACAYIAIRQSERSMQKKYKQSLYWKNYRKHVCELHSFYQTLRGIEVTNDDVFRILASDYDWSKSFIYLDPPYHEEAMATKKHYRNNWKKEHHDRLVELLLERPLGKVALSGLDNSSYVRLEEAGWKKIPLKNLRVKLSSKGRHQLEQLWINFDIPFWLEVKVREFL